MEHMKNAIIINKIFSQRNLASRDVSLSLTNVEWRDLEEIYIFIR